MKKILSIFLLSISLNLFPQNIPVGFVEIREVIPDIVLDLRYTTNHNFLGVPVQGYKAEKCYITKAAADSLAKVQAELRKFNLSLKIYDAYRPQRSVDDFVRWAKNLSDTLTKKEFYPTVEKSRLFVDDFVRWAKNLSDTLTKKEFYPTVEKSRLFFDGYIAEKSVHSRGSTVDLTIVPIPLPHQPEFDINNQCECYESVDKRFKDNSIDMGTGFDCFNELSHTENPNLTPQQRANRLLLNSLMDKYGFKNLAEEWWHYTLRNEPFPQTYFDFVIE